MAAGVPAMYLNLLSPSPSPSPATRSDCRTLHESGKGTLCRSSWLHL
jgi:hypothetical protein